MSDAAENAARLAERKLQADDTGFDLGPDDFVTARLPGTKQVVPKAVWRTYCDMGSITYSDNRDSRKRVFNRAAETLQARGYIGVWNDLVWITGTTGT